MRLLPRGAKWTKSQIFHRDNPAAIVQNGPPLDPGVLNCANEFRSFTCNNLTFNCLDDVGTFDVNNALEIRDITGITALGADGFNPPSLLSIRYHAPYLHRGQAQTAPEVFPLHRLGAPPNTITTVLTAQQQADLLAFLRPAALCRRRLSGRPEAARHLSPASYTVTRRPAVETLWPAATSGAVISVASETARKCRRLSPSHTSRLSLRIGEILGARVFTLYHTTTCEGPHQTND